MSRLESPETPHSPFSHQTRPSATDWPQRTHPEPSVPEDGVAYRFRLIGGLWSVRFGDEAASVRDYDGMRYFAALLEKPGRYIPAAVLCNLVRPGGPPRPRYRFDDAGPEEKANGRWSPRSLPVVSPDEVSVSARPIQEVLDWEAVRDYRRRIGWLDESLAATGDRARLDSLAREKRFIERELREAREMGGRMRALGSTPEEKARQRVRQAVNYAGEKLRPTAPALARHLRSSVRADAHAYAYLPAGDPPDWAL